MNKVEHTAQMCNITLEALHKAAGWADNYRTPTTSCCNAEIDECPEEWWRCEKCGKLVWPDGRVFGKEEKR